MAANVDASRALDELAAVLSEGREPSRCQEAMEVCEREKPASVEIEEGHWVSCHLHKQSLF